MCDLIGVFWHIVIQQDLSVQMERVPTDSNPADGPRRGACEDLETRGAEWVDMNLCPQVLSEAYWNTTPKKPSPSSCSIMHSATLSCTISTTFFFEINFSAVLDSMKEVSFTHGLLPKRWKMFSLGRGCFSSINAVAGFASPVGGPRGFGSDRALPYFNRCWFVGAVLLQEFGGFLAGSPEAGVLCLIHIGLPSVGRPVGILQDKSRYILQSSGGDDGNTTHAYLGAYVKVMKTGAVWSLGHDDSRETLL